MLRLNFVIQKKTSSQLLRTFLFFIIVAIGINNSFANNSLSNKDKTSKRKKTKMAEMYFANKNYSDAAPILFDLLLLDRKNTDLNNMLGVCYFNLESQKIKTKNISSIPPLVPLFFTNELSTSDSSILEKYKNMPRVEEVNNPENNLSYIVGRYVNYKDIVKAKKELEKKGFKNIRIRMIQNNKLLKEPKQKGYYYTIQILALQLPIAPEIFNQLDNVKIHQGEDGLSRYTYKIFRTLTAAKHEMNRLIRLGYWDSFIQTVINDKLVYPKMKFSTSTAYTIQLISLKEIRPVSYFKNLKGVNVYRDSNNIYRYSYKIFPSKYEAQLALGEVLRKNYWGAFVRKAYWGEEILFSNFKTKKSNKYTIQIMALNNPKPLNCFNNLPVVRLNMNKKKNGLSRYTYDTFKDKEEAKSYLNVVFKKGYFDAFTHTIKWYNKN